MISIKRYINIKTILSPLLMRSYLVVSLIIFLAAGSVYLISFYELRNQLTQSAESIAENNLTFYRANFKMLKDAYNYTIKAA